MMKSFDGNPAYDFVDILVWTANPNSESEASRNGLLLIQN